MSQALDLRLRINTIDDGIEQQVPKFDNSNTEGDKNRIFCKVN